MNYRGEYCTGSIEITIKTKVILEVHKLDYFDKK